MVDVEAVVQQAVAHLEASFAKGNKYAHYAIAEGLPGYEIREIFTKVQEHFPERIARLDRRPAGGGFSARIYLTNPVRITMVRGRLTPN